MFRPADLSASVDCITLGQTGTGSCFAQSSPTCGKQELAKGSPRTQTKLGTPFLFLRITCCYPPEHSKNLLLSAETHTKPAVIRRDTAKSAVIRRDTVKTCCYPPRHGQTCCYPSGQSCYPVSHLQIYLSSKMPQHRTCPYGIKNAGG